MKKNLLVILTIVLSSNMLFAQLNGTYTINQSIAASASNYQSFSAAAAALNTLGINGPVVFNVSNGPYTERVTINQITGASAINTMTINGNGDTLKYNCNHGSIGVLEFIGTDFLTVDNLVIYNSEPVTFGGMCIKMVNGTDENIISNCTIQAGTFVSNNSNAGIRLYAPVSISSSPSLSSSSSNFSNNNPGNNNLFTGNTFKYGRYQLQIIGADVNKPSNNEISNNYFEDSGINGITILGSSHTLISGNDFSRPFSGVDVPGLKVAINLGSISFYYYNEFLVVEKNKIHTFYNSGIDIVRDNVEAGKETMIKNNVIYLNQATPINDGIYFYLSSGVRIFHNTITLKNTSPTINMTITGVRMSSITGLGNIEIKNNIFDIFGTANSYGISIYHGIITDNNVFNMNGGSRAVKAVIPLAFYPTAASWSSSGFGGANSFDAVPNYVNPAGLNFLPQAASIIDAGDNLSPIVSDDITGATRPMGAFPDPGAYEMISTLPVELLNFDATNKDETVEIYWSTASEINNAYFTILRSKNGYDFEQIGTEQGAGNSNTILNYATHDIQPYTGLSYYQLKQTDYDGTFKFSNIVAVNRDPLSIISIYPNPAESLMQIVIGSNKDSDVTIQAINSLGQSVITTSQQINKGETTITIDVSSLAKGVYYLQVITPDKEHVQKEFIRK